MQLVKKPEMLSQRKSNSIQLQTSDEKLNDRRLKEFFDSRIESAIRGNYRDVDVDEIIKATIDKSKCNQF